MPAITVRKLTEEIHRALKARAARHGRSTESEVREILREAVAGEDLSGFGTRLHQKAAAVGGFDLNLVRDNTVTEPISFS